MQRPFIGITCGAVPEARDKREPTRLAYDFLKRQYYEAVEAVGGIPVLLPNSRNHETTAGLVDRLDGILFSGGEDVDPSFYGESRKAKNLQLAKERDTFELHLIKVVRERQLPVFGICRGHQVLNVGRGGSLFQDLSFRTEPTIDHAQGGGGAYQVRHGVNVQKGTRLYAIVKSEFLDVNTSHHQMVKSVAPGLLVNALSREDGVVEGLEDPLHPFWISVEWHPEAMPKEESSVRLFTAFIEAAKKR